MNRMDSLLQIFDRITGYVRRKAEFRTEWTIYYKFEIRSLIAGDERQSFEVDGRSSQNLRSGHRLHETKGRISKHGQFATNLRSGHRFRETKGRLSQPMDDLL